MKAGNDRLSGAIDGMPSFSPRIYRFFLAYLKRYFGKNFTAVRTSRTGHRLQGLDGPLLVVTNHPSWWDPIHFGLLNHHEAGDREIYGPMEAAMVEQYGIFKKVGVFPVEATPRGAVQFLRVGEAILSRNGVGLWITAEGHFSDPRTRPVTLKQGTARLLTRLAAAGSNVTVLPLALEYPFWDERLPEALSRFGEPIEVAAHAHLDAAGWHQLLVQRLTQTMDVLAEESATRDPARFRTLQAGRVGIGGIYDRWRRIKALLAGRRFDAAHGGPVDVTRKEGGPR